MSAHCEGLDPDQIEWTDRFKRYMSREGIVEAGHSEYVSKLDIGRVHATVFVTSDIPRDSLYSVSKHFVAFMITVMTSVRNFHISICD
jgi:hypothetical protein